MSQQEAVDQGLQMVPKWWPVIIAVITVLCSAGASYSTVGTRLAESERRIDVIERDRAEKLRDYYEFKEQVAGLRADIKWLRETISPSR